MVIVAIIVGVVFAYVVVVLVYADAAVFVSVVSLSMLTLLM